MYCWLVAVSQVGYLREVTGISPGQADLEALGAELLDRLIGLMNADFRLRLGWRAIILDPNLLGDLWASDTPGS